ncbi:hypothetical protein HH214_04685 [Mucilaginibacter robiniae]|uniref:Methionyl-tRNA formyltransferase n=1 Tax=Mucilaginibacter robiniae TaxID=2728022 RepID=A0A7L5E356_9SPHI|nr:formyltransferase family protein [Mucilaginibacter robiniae]QJD95223.1 hypothetical protein HH214_04685 [Mucilaginibacter robiniae]
MKIIFFTNQLAALPLLSYFHTKGWLKAVIHPHRQKASDFQIEDFCCSAAIPFHYVGKAEFHELITDLFDVIAPDLAVMFGFSYHIPECLFTRPRLGFYNIHFSMLPAYRGPNPIFWQIKNGETVGGVSIHQVDSGWDTGPIVMQQQVSFIPGETWGICNSRHSAVAYNLMVQLADQLQYGLPLPQISIPEQQATYYSKPAVEEFAIDWQTSTATQIENLVNACNPNVGGAIASLKHQMVRILEVSPVDAVADAATPPGTVVHSDQSGMYVSCVDRKILRINILKLNEGFMTGFKLAALGIQPGDVFENARLVLTAKEQII